MDRLGLSRSNLDGTLKDVRKLVQNADTKIDGLASNLDGAVTDVRGLVKNADTKVAGLTTNLDGAVTDVRGLVKNVDGKIGPVTASIEGTLKKLDATLIQAQKAIEKVEGTVAEDSPAIYELNKTLEDVSALARSIRTLTDYLERRPETVDPRQMNIGKEMKMKNGLIRILAILTLGVILGIHFGCASSPPARFYLLEPSGHPPSRDETFRG